MQERPALAVLGEDGTPSPNIFATAELEEAGAPSAKKLWEVRKESMPATNDRNATALPVLEEDGTSAAIKFTKVELEEVGAPAAKDLDKWKREMCGQLKAAE